MLVAELPMLARGKVDKNSHANRVYSTPVLNLGIVDETRREL